MKIVGDFQTRLYREHNQEKTVDNTSIPLVLNQCSEDIPAITIDDVLNSLSGMKNNRAPGENGVLVEAIKHREDELLRTIIKLVNQYLDEPTTTQVWNNAIIVHKKDTITD